MNSFIYDIPTKVYFGEHQLSHLGEELAKYGKRVLLTYGGGSIKKSGLYDAVAAEVKAAGLTLFELSGIEPNPRIDSVRAGAELYHVALAGQSQRVGNDGEAAKDERIAAALAGGFIVGATVQKAALHRAQVFLPLVFDINQRPLPPAEGEVLQAGQLEKVFVAIHRHPMRVQVMPAGRAASSTETA